MTPSFDVFTTGYLLGAVQALLMAIVLLSIKGGNRMANRLLGAVLLIVALVSASKILYLSQHIVRVPHLARTHQPLAFIMGPLLLFYAQAVTSGSFSFKRKHALHFIPFVAYAAYTVPFYLQSAAYKRQFLIENFAAVSPEWYLNASLIITYGFLYHVLALGVLLRHLQQHNVAVRSSVRGSFMSLWLVLFAVFSSDAAQFFRLFYHYQWDVNYVGPFLNMAFLYAFTFIGLKESGLFAGGKQPRAQGRYAGSTLLPDRAEHYLGQLQYVMGTEKPFLDSRLTLQRLADRLSILNRHLSQIINEQLDQNFHDFVNGYRVEEAKKMLLDPNNRHWTIEAIAQEAGFSSRTAFYTAFKKHVGMTPSQFKKACSES